MSTPLVTASPLALLDWGRTGYDDARARQEGLVARRIAGEIGDTLVFTEHDPVFTIGLRRGADAHLLWNEEERAREGVALASTNRGGDITYHGPGQIVGYPIVSLDRHRDLHAYLRLLEQAVIDALATFGLRAARREGQTGIWMDRRKIAAIGVAVRRWVTYHGFALNLDPNLRHFAGIVPCGIAPADGAVTSVQAELGQSIEPSLMKAELHRALARRLDAVLAGRPPEALRGAAAGASLK